MEWFVSKICSDYKYLKGKGQHLDKIIWSSSEESKSITWNKKEEEVDVKQVKQVKDVKDVREVKDEEAAEQGKAQMKRTSSDDSS